jgi:hypothetical protein
MVFRIDKKVLRLGIEWNRKTQRCLTAREGRREGRRGEGRKKQVNFKAGIVACKNKKGNSAYFATAFWTIVPVRSKLSFDTNLKMILCRTIGTITQTQSVGQSRKINP